MKKYFIYVLILMAFIPFKQGNADEIINIVREPLADPKGYNTYNPVYIYIHNENNLYVFNNDRLRRGIYRMDLSKPNNKRGWIRQTGIDLPNDALASSVVIHNNFMYVYFGPGFDVNKGNFMEIYSIDKIGNLKRVGKAIYNPAALFKSKGGTCTKLLMYENVMYAVVQGGFGGQGGLLSARIDEDGQPQKWNSLGLIPLSSIFSNIGIVGNYIFGFGDKVGGGLPRVGRLVDGEIYRAEIRSDGTIGYWIADLSIPGDIWPMTMFFYKNNIIVGGFNRITDKYILYVSSLSNTYEIEEWKMMSEKEYNNFMIFIVKGEFSGTRFNLTERTNGGTITREGNVISVATNNSIVFHSITDIKGNELVGRKLEMMPAKKGAKTALKNESVIIDIVNLNGNIFVHDIFQKSLLVSQDEGKTFNTTGLNEVHIYDLKVDSKNNIIYALTSDSLKSSMDNGKTWETLINGLPKFNIMKNEYQLINNSIAISPANPDVIYLFIPVGSTGEIYKTDNRGKKWLKRMSGLKGELKNIVCDPVDPNKAYVFSRHVNVGDFIFETKDKGISWKIIEQINFGRHEPIYSPGVSKINTDVVIDIIGYSSEIKLLKQIEYITFYRYKNGKLVHSNRISNFLTRYLPITIFPKTEADDDVLFGNRGKLYVYNINAGSYKLLIDGATLLPKNNEKDGDSFVNLSYKDKNIAYIMISKYGGSVALRGEKDRPISMLKNIAYYDSGTTSKNVEEQTNLKTEESKETETVAEQTSKNNGDVISGNWIINWMYRGKMYQFLIHIKQIGNRIEGNSSETLAFKAGPKIVNSIISGEITGTEIHLVKKWIDHPNKASNQEYFGKTDKNTGRISGKYKIGDINGDWYMDRAQTDSYGGQPPENKPSGNVENGVKRFFKKMFTPKK